MGVRNWKRNWQRKKKKLKRANYANLLKKPVKNVPDYVQKTMTKVNVNVMNFVKKGIKIEQDNVTLNAPLRNAAPNWNGVASGTFPNKLLWVFRQKLPELPVTDYSIRGFLTSQEVLVLVMVTMKVTMFIVNLGEKRLPWPITFIDPAKISIKRLMEVPKILKSCGKLTALFRIKNFPERIVVLARLPGRVQFSSRRTKMIRSVWISFWILLNVQVTSDLMMTNVAIVIVIKDHPNVEKITKIIVFVKIIGIYYVFCP